MLTRLCPCCWSLVSSHIPVLWIRFYWLLNPMSPVWLTSTPALTPSSTLPAIRHSGRDAEEPSSRCAGWAGEEQRRRERERRMKGKEGKRGGARLFPQGRRRKQETGRRRRWWARWMRGERPQETQLSLQEENCVLGHLRSKLTWKWEHIKSCWLLQNSNAMWRVSVVSLLVENNQHPRQAGKETVSNVSIFKINIYH